MTDEDEEIEIDLEEDELWNADPDCDHDIILPEEAKVEIKDLSDGKELWDADPDCDHDVVCAPGGGIKCTKCPGWFCF